MTFETLANAIRSRFKTQVVGSTGLAVAYDNAPFTEPADSKWVRFAVLEADSSQVSLGTGRRFRTPGVAVAQIFVPIQQGDKDALVLADQIKLAFRAQSVGGVVYKTPSLRRVGRTGKWYQINVNCPFYADDIEGA